MRSTVPARVRALPFGRGVRGMLALDCTHVSSLAELAQRLRAEREEKEERERAEIKEEENMKPKTEEKGKDERAQPGGLDSMLVVPDFVRQQVPSRFTKPENLATKELYPRQFERWTGEEKKYLRVSWGVVPPLEMLSVLQRSWRSVGIYWQYEGLPWVPCYDMSNPGFFDETLALKPVPVSPGIPVVSPAQASAAPVPSAMEEEEEPVGGRQGPQEAARAVPEPSAGESGGRGVEPACGPPGAKRGGWYPYPFLESLKPLTFAMVVTVPPGPGQVSCLERLREGAVRLCASDPDGSRYVFDVTTPKHLTFFQVEAGCDHQALKLASRKLGPLLQTLGSQMAGERGPPGLRGEYDAAEENNEKE